MSYDWIPKLCIKTKSKIIFTEKLSFTALHFSEDGVSAHKIIFMCIIVFIKGLNFAFLLLLLLIELTFQDFSFNLLEQQSGSAFCFYRSSPSANIAMNQQCNLTMLTTSLGLFRNWSIVEINILLPLGNLLKFFPSLVIYPV